MPGSEEETDDRLVSPGVSQPLTQTLVVFIFSHVCDRKIL